MNRFGETLHFKNKAIYQQKEHRMPPTCPPTHHCSHVLVPRAARSLWFRKKFGSVRFQLMTVRVMTTPCTTSGVAAMRSV